MCRSLFSHLLVRIWMKRLIHFFCFLFQFNIAARNLSEGVDSGADHTQAMAKLPRKSLTSDTNTGEPKRHTMHFVGQRNQESQPVGLQRRSLDISSSERLADALDSSSSSGSVTSQNTSRQVTQGFMTLTYY